MAHTPRNGLLLLALLSLSAGSAPAQRLLSEIRTRDPFILADKASRIYYLVSSVDRPRGSPRGGVSVLTSKELESWAGPVSVFDVPVDFWGQKGVWAPEMHAYEGKYYIFTTFSTDDKFLGKIRLEAATGQDFSDVVSIPKPDGMMERALQLVKWLAKENPPGVLVSFRIGVRRSIRNIACRTTEYS